MDFNKTTTMQCYLIHYRQFRRLEMCPMSIRLTDACDEELSDVLFSRTRTHVSVATLTFILPDTYGFVNTHRFHQSLRRKRKSN